MKPFVAARKTIKRYFTNIFLWIDIGLNVIIMAGSPYETISSRVGKNSKLGKPWAIFLEKVIDAVLGESHCDNSEVTDYGLNTFSEDGEGLF